MRIPSRFSYRGKGWRILWCSPPDADEDWTENPWNQKPFAETEQGTRTIYVNPRRAKDVTEKLDTFLHEVLHVIDLEHENDPGWHLTHAMISRLARPLAQFLIENRIPLTEASRCVPSSARPRSRPNSSSPRQSSR